MSTTTASNTPGRRPTPRAKPALPPRQPNPFAGLRDPYQDRPDVMPQPKQAAGVRAGGALQPKVLSDSAERVKLARQRRDEQGRFQQADPFGKALRESLGSTSIPGALGLDPAAPAEAAPEAPAEPDAPAPEGFGGGFQDATVPRGGKGSQQLGDQVRQQVFGGSASGDTEFTV